MSRKSERKRKLRFIYDTTAIDGDGEEPMVKNRRYIAGQCGIGQAWAVLDRFELRFLSEHEIDELPMTALIQEIPAWVQ
jgi:hypothetical protein